MESNLNLYALNKVRWHLFAASCSLAIIKLVIISQLLCQLIIGLAEVYNKKDLMVRPSFLYGVRINF